ncbi:hypothetical protein [Roseateles sp.]|uniref:hypothetical protein n=1 Tax=Roseateles sp. TaxID=1971397 RepID=UPI0031D92113
MNATSKHPQSLWPVVAGTLVAVLAAMAQPAHAGLLGGGGGLSGGASGHVGGTLGGNLGGLAQRPDLSRGRDALEGTRDRADQATGKLSDRAQQAGGKLKGGADQATGQITDRAREGLASAPTVSASPSPSTGSTTPPQATPPQATPSQRAQGGGSVNATGSSQAQRDTRGVNAQGGVSVEAKGQASKPPGQ